MNSAVVRKECASECEWHMGCRSETPSTDFCEQLEGRALQMTEASRRKVS